MAGILLPNKFQRQPQYPSLLDKNHWLVKDTTLAINGATPYFNSVNGNRLFMSPGGIGYSQRATSQGISLYTPNGGWIDYTLSQDWAGPNTIIVFCLINSMDNPWGGLFSKNSVGTNSQFSVGRASFNDTLYGAVDNTTSEFSGSNSISTILGSFGVMAFTHSGATSSAMSYYRNGQLVGSSLALPAQLSGSSTLALGVARDRNPSFDSDVDWLAFIRVRRVLSPIEIASISKDIWSLWKAPERHVWSDTITGFNSYELSPNGTISFSGSNNLLKSKIFLPLGQVSFTGTHSFIKTKIITPSGNIVFSGDNILVKTKIVSASGSINFSGTSPVIRSKIIESSGGVVFSGTASLSGAVSYIITPTGNVTFNGSSHLIKTHIQIPTGRISFSGNSPIASNTVIITISTRLPLTGVGK